VSQKVKTNAMRLLEQEKISYKSYTYPWDGKNAPDGITVANFLQEDPNRVFKTLVTVGESGLVYVFDIPVAETLDLKKAAKAVKEKNITMMKSKDLFVKTGYVHGGCSPIGMKKQYSTVFDETCILYESIIVSGGKIGCQLEVSTNDLIDVTRATVEDVIVRS